MAIYYSPHCAHQLAVISEFEDEIGDGDDDEWRNTCRALADTRNMSENWCYLPVESLNGHCLHLT